MSELAARARLAARSAHRLLEDGDYASAVSRAYYAMFDLTRAMLQEIDPKLVAAKTHTTIISRFSRHLVRDRGLPREAGRVLRRVFNARILTEYSASAVALNDAREAVELMDRFFEAVATKEDSASDG
jgi:uncharacterized protein